MKIEKSDIGKEVHDILLGKGRIATIIESNTKIITYCVAVEFLSKDGERVEFIKYYTQDGRFDIKYNPTLSLSEMILVPKHTYNQRLIELDFYKTRPWWKVWANPENSNV